jgi:glycerol kinase
MENNKYILAIDQGTSATKALIVDGNGIVVAKGVSALHTSYLPNGLVEQDAEAIYINVLDAVKTCIGGFVKKNLDVKSIVSIGISNQRETFVDWNSDGKALHPAIVWQCKRSVAICEKLQQEPVAVSVKEKTGLRIDPYFSATKLIWLLQENAAVKEAVRNNNAFFGTIDTWLLYKLTNGKSYATDYTNASRTLLFNLLHLKWDSALIKTFGLTGFQFPEIKNSAAYFGDTALNGWLPAAIPIHAMIGDSQAAAFGEGCFEKGSAKATLGTGCSILMNIGDKPVISENGLVTTVCWSMEGRVDYALEGVIVSCGATLEWMKNEMNLFTDAADTAAMATRVHNNGGVYLVPAFSGLGSPYWDMERTASISGMRFGTTKNHLVRAALESIAYQVNAVILAMEKDADLLLTALMADGGIAANPFVIQFLADVLNLEVGRIGFPDISALGAAYLAGLGVKLYPDLETIQLFNRQTIKQLPGNHSVHAQNGFLCWEERVIHKK